MKLVEKASIKLSTPYQQKLWCMETIKIMNKSNKKIIANKMLTSVNLFLFLIALLTFSIKTL